MVDRGRPVVKPMLLPTPIRLGEELTYSFSTMPLGGFKYLLLPECAAARICCCQNPLLTGSTAARWPDYMSMLNPKLSELSVSAEVCEAAQRSREANAGQGYPEVSVCTLVVPRRVRNLRF